MSTSTHEIRERLEQLSGNASQSEKYPTLQHEVAGLNEMIMGAEVDFAYNSGGTFWSDALVNVSASQRNWGESAAGRSLTPQTHEAWLRLVLPKELKPRIGWLLQIHALHRAQGMQLVSQWGSTAQASAEGDDPKRGFEEAYHKEESVDGDDQATALVISVRLDELQYTQAYGTVRVAGHSEANDPLLEHGDLIIDEEHLIG